AVYASAYRSLNAQVKAQLARDLTAIERTLLESPEELGELDEHGTVSLFRVDRDNEPIFVADNWKRTGFDAVLTTIPADKDHVHPVTAARRFRLETRTVRKDGREFRLAAAIDEEPAQHALADLGEILAIASPLAILIACIGGYFLAGRMLAPVAALAVKAQEITADRLSERLPGENPDDEIGRVGAGFTPTLPRVEESFQLLPPFTAHAQQ